MSGNSPENLKKNLEKLFSHSAKPSGKSVLPFYVLSILVDVWAEKIPPVSVKNIQQIIHRQMKVFYERKGIETAINNLHEHCPNIELVHSKERVGPRRQPVQYFSIKFKI